MALNRKSGHWKRLRHIIHNFLPPHLLDSTARFDLSVYQRSLSQLSFEREGKKKKGNGDRVQQRGCGGRDKHKLKESTSINLLFPKKYAFLNICRKSNLRHRDEYG